MRQETRCVTSVARILPAWRLTEARWTATAHRLNPFVSNQDEYSLIFRAPEAELMPAARAAGMGMLPFFPLASGLLTGKYRRNAPMPPGTRLAATQRLADRYLTERNWIYSAEKLGDFVEARGKTMLELAFSWLLAREPVASVIAGATKPEQQNKNVKAGGWKLTADELSEIDRILPRRETFQRHARLSSASSALTMRLSFAGKRH